jgi:hypothetical protein
MPLIITTKTKWYDAIWSFRVSTILVASMPRRVHALPRRLAQWMKANLQRRTTVSSRWLVAFVFEWFALAKRPSLIYQCLLMLACPLSDKWSCRKLHDVFSRWRSIVYSTWRRHYMTHQPVGVSILLPTSRAHLYHMRFVVCCYLGVSLMTESFLQRRATVPWWIGSLPL